MSETKINVFGKEILIMPNAFITYAEKVNNNLVSIVKENQNKIIVKYPLDTMQLFGKSADEFIDEFNAEVKQKCVENDTDNKYGFDYTMNLK